VTALDELTPPAEQDLAPAVDVRVRTVSRGRKVRNDIAIGGLYVAMVVAVIPLVAVIWTVVAKGLSGFSLGFLTNDLPHITNLTDAQIKALGLNISTKPAAGPAVVGTLLITAAASAMAIPLGVLGAVYLNEYGKQKPFARVVRFMSDVMVGVPSVVLGLFIYSVWVLRFGQSGLAGALALACLMLPIVIRTAEEMLRLVPDELRTSSAALGSRTWRTTCSVVLPAALPGIVSGAMLAVARAAGETAPVLFTIGVVTATNTSLSGPNTTLSLQIFSNAKSANPLANQIAWTAALTLICLVFVLTLLSRLISARFASKRA
jgi:phosphate transport system permease protein